MNNNIEHLGYFFDKNYTFVIISDISSTPDLLQNVNLYILVISLSDRDALHYLNPIGHGYKGLLHAIWGGGSRSMRLQDGQRGYQ